MGTNDTAMLEVRRQWAATLYALAELVKAGEIEGGDGSTVAMYNFDAEVWSEFPALSVALDELADGVMEQAYGDEGWSEGDDGFEQRAELLYAILDTDVPAIMDVIRIGSMESALCKQRRDEAA